MKVDYKALAAKVRKNGKNQEHIPLTLHIKKQVVEHAFQHRHRYEPMIIEGLQKIFPEREISRPYLVGKKGKFATD